MDDSKRLELEGKWDQVRGRVKESWGVLTDDELDRTEGKWDRLVGLIKEKTLAVLTRIAPVNLGLWVIGLGVFRFALG